MRKGFKKALSFVLSAAMVLSLGSGLDIAPASAADGAAGTGNTPAATVVTYGAMVGFQTNSYDYRDGFEQIPTDTKYNEWLQAKGKEAPAYNNVNIYKVGNGPSLYTKGDKKGTLDEASAEKSELVEGATVSDAVMSADGEYTVSIKDLDLGKDKEGNFYMLDIATNIVKDDVNSAVKAKASSIKVNGKEIATNVDLPAKGGLKKGAYYKFMIANGYAPEDKTSPDPLYQAIEGEAPNTKLAAPTGKFDIEVTFTLQGVDWTYVPAAATPTPVPTQAPEVTAPPEVPLSTSFDMVLSANVVEALTPSAGPDIRQDPTDAKKAIQSAVFGSEAMKTKVVAAKTADNKALFDPNTMDYIVSDNSCATISKTGEYALSVTARSDMPDITKSGAIWFPIIINGSTGVMPKDFNLKATKIIVGEGASAKEYAWTSQLMQDAKGDVRLSVNNQWATDVEKEVANTIKDEIPVKKGDKITFKFYVVAEAPAPAKTATPVAVVPSTSYKAYLGLQTDDWLFRDVWHGDNGLKCKDYDYTKQVAWSHDGKTNPINVTSITDATMEKNGVKYKVAITGLNVKKVSSASTKFNMLYLSTDIPLSMKGVSVKDAVLKIDGKVIKEYKVVPNKGDASKYYQFMLADAYAPADGTKDAAYPSGSELKTFPTDSIEIEYTVNGVDFNSKTIGVKKGKTFTQGNFKYKVTKAVVLSGDNKVSKGTVQVVGLSKKGKKKASLSLGATAKVTSKAAIATAASVMTYKIASVKSGAFKNSAKLKKFSFKKATNVKTLPSKVFMNCKKLKSVELSKKMKKIPAKAFMGCKKLTTIKCNAKLKSVSKTAFKKCKKKIKVTGKSKKANKKKIKKVYKKVK